MTNDLGISVFVNSFYVTRASRIVGIDVDIACGNLNMTIYNFTVVLDDGRVKITLPENFCSGTLRDYPTIKIYDREKSNYIISVIENIVIKEKWLMQFLTEGSCD